MSGTYPQYILLILLVSAICFLCYRIVLHPLSRYPGPTSGRLSSLYAVYYAFKGELHLQTLDAHAKYGEKMKNDHVFNTIDPHLHRARSKVVRRAIGPQVIQHFEATLLQQVDIFVQKLNLRCGNNRIPLQQVNITELCELLALDVVGRLVFGYSFDLQTHKYYIPVHRAIKLQCFMFNIFMQQPFFKRILSPLLALSTFLGYQDPFLRTLNVIIDTRESDDKDGKTDFYSVAADKIDRTSMFSEGGLLLLAGSETVSTGTSALFFYLSRNPRCYQMLAKEIRTSFTSASDICQGTRLASCQYLRACIDEALRMSPPIPATLWRTQVQGDDAPLIIDGHFIPKGTEVGVNTYAFHHNKDIFPNSFCFNPERWLGCSSGNEKLEIQRRAFAVFSTGAPGCPGKAITYLEISLVIAKTLWYFDFDSGLGGLENSGNRKMARQFEVKDRYTSTHDGPHLVFHPRKEASDVDFDRNEGLK
ncbi:cytochrome P450 [Xylaria castorea]|nr:cytochrome P450 [Xylaria castorea]